MITVQEVLDSNWPMGLAKNPNDEGAFDGSCPCGSIEGQDFLIEFHCWRSGCAHGCRFSGIHVSGSIDASTKMKLAEHIRDTNGWTNSTEWNIVIL